MRARLSRLDGAPAAILAALAAALAFAVALAVGSATAGSHETVAVARREQAPKPPAPLPVLGPVPALPAAPPARRRTTVRRSPAPQPRSVRARPPRRAAAIRPAHPPAPVPKPRLVPKPPARVAPPPVPKLLSGTG